MKIDTSARIGINPNSDATPGTVTVAKSIHLHADEDLLNSVIVTGRRVKQVVRISGRSRYFEDAVLLLVQVTGGTGGNPVRVADTTIEVVLKPVNCLAEIHRHSHGQVNGNLCVGRNLISGYILGVIGLVGRSDRRN